MCKDSLSLAPPRRDRIKKAEICARLRKRITCTHHRVIHQGEKCIFFKHIIMHM